MLRQLAATVVAGGCLASASCVPAVAQFEEAQREIAAGGLMFVNDPALVIMSQEVQISSERIKVIYGVRNTATVARTVLIVFPLPDLNMAAIGEQHVDVAGDEPANFVAADATADGAPVPLEISQRALALTLDVTQILQDLKLPLFPLAKGTGELLTNLAPIAKLDLQQRGIVRLDDGTAAANWTLKSTAHWRQTFQPGQLLSMTISYRPIAARARFDAALIDQLRSSHCIDATVEAAMTRLVASRGGKVLFRWLSYALTAGSDTTGTIGSFRLLIAKPEINAVVATCRRDLRTTGPTTLEWSATNFEPDEDLHVLFVH